MTKTPAHRRRKDPFRRAVLGVLKPPPPVEERWSITADGLAALEREPVNPFGQPQTPRCRRCRLTLADCDGHRAPVGVA